MLFNSIEFLIFLPLVFFGYWFVFKSLRWQNLFVVAVSYLFYGWWDWRFLLLILFTSLCSYLSGVYLEKCAGNRSVQKWISAGNILLNLSILGVFKYFDFFTENLVNVLHLLGWDADYVTLNILLPVGISFYTFQIISYTVDVYRGEPAQKNLIHLAAYVAMFPQLIAGPIVRYSDIAQQLEHRSHSTALAAEGVRRFLIGLGKKILIANQLGELCSVFRASDEKSVLFYWLYAVAFALHIYFDFSGYSDMAIGLGKVFGFHFLENFNYPYISASITEFWRRWHISLGTWFRDYVYIPLGGNRVGRARQLLNILVVWMLTGFWHGAAWNFVVWGLMFAVLLIMEKLWLLKPLSKCRPLAHLYVVFFVVISFVIFNAENMGQALSDIGGLFGAGGIPLVSAEAVYCLRSFALVLILAVFGATPLLRNGLVRLSQYPTAGKVLNALEPFTLFILLLVMTGYLVDGSFNPFLYFRF